MQTVLGLDEAGRGCVIGPLVVAGVVASEEQVRALGELGVRDSKRLTRRARERLAAEIEHVAQRIILIEIGPSDLEENLTEVELRAMGQIIRESKAERVYLDLPVGPAARERFTHALRERVGAHLFDLVAENRADATYPVVSAASIIAKVSRDRAIDRLRHEYGDIGWGYPSEPKTRAFLREFYERTGRFPPCARRKWHTLQKLMERSPGL